MLSTKRLLHVVEMGKNLVLELSILAYVIKKVNETRPKNTKIDKKTHYFHY